MQLKVFYSWFRKAGFAAIKSLLAMKILILLITISCFQIQTSCYSQTITLSLNNASLERIFIEIKKQSGYSFVYTREQINKSQPVSVNVKDASINQALDICFANQPLAFSIDNKYVIVQGKNIQNNSSTAKKSPG